MALLYVPYHLDQHEPDLNVPLPAGFHVSELTDDLPEAADIWSSIVGLYEAVACAVEAAAPTASRTSWGAIVLEQQLHAPGSIPIFTIIDSQQR